MQLMKLFKKNRSSQRETARYDAEHTIPAIRCSICTGEKTAGFKDRSTGRFTEVMPIRSERDLAQFRTKYGITVDIEKFY